MAQTTRLTNDRPIKIRRIIPFHGSSSLGIVIPSNFIEKMGLSAGQYVKCEMDNEGNSFSVDKIL